MTNQKLDPELPTIFVAFRQPLSTITIIGRQDSILKPPPSMRFPEWKLEPTYSMCSAQARGLPTYPEPQRVGSTANTPSVSTYQPRHSFYCPQPSPGHGRDSAEGSIDDVCSRDEEIGPMQWRGVTFPPNKISVQTPRGASRRQPFGQPNNYIINIKKRSGKIWPQNKSGGRFPIVYRQL